MTDESPERMLHEGRPRGRFAPSTTGRVHPGTLLAALLCWLDARSRGGEVLLRLEDLDRDRTRPGFVDAMQRDLERFGLDWDGVSRQSEQIERYDAKLEALVREQRIYACTCSRAQIRERSTAAPDGSFRYPGSCRDRLVSLADWREGGSALRIRMEALRVEVHDESGIDLSGDPVALFGDPIVRRRDGAYSYHFTSVLDDEAAGIDRIVRGRDLAPSTTLQVGLREAFGFAVPRYRHHALFLEAHGEKLSKLHGAVDMRALEERHDAETLCGLLASFIGLLPDAVPCRPHELVADFDWSRVREDDVTLDWSEATGLRSLSPG